MTPAWHIARKDLHRLRWILLLWAVVLTGQLALATLQAHLEASGALPVFLSALIFGRLFIPVFGFGLVFGVLRDDSPADSDAFWVTRPISGGDLLAAKGTVLLIVSVLPALLAAPWWLVHGYDAGEFGAALVHVVRWQAALSLLALGLAAVSATIGRFVMTSFATALLFVALLVAFARCSDDRLFSEHPLDVGTWMRVMAWIWMATSIAVAVHQFLTRRTGRSLLLAASAVVAGFALTLLLPAPPATGPATLTATPPVRVAASLPPVLGAAAGQGSYRIRVTDAVPDFTRGWVVALNESSPDFTPQPWVQAPARVVAPTFETYFLVDPRDGRWTRGTVTRTDGNLTAATLHFFRREVVFPPPAGSGREAAFNFNAWVKDTALVKLTSSTELTDFPSHLVPAPPAKVP